MSEDFLVVRGEATEQVPADHADIAFGIDAKAPTANEASTKVLEGSVAVGAALDALGDLVARRRTTSLTVTVNQWYDPETGRHRTDGYQAHQSVSVRLADPAQTAGAIRAVQAASEVSVAGPWWGIADENDAHDRVRAAAAADARRRAEAYATGLGVSVGKVRRVADPSARPTLPGPPAPVGAARDEGVMRSVAAPMLVSAEVGGGEDEANHLPAAALDGLVVGEVEVSDTIEVAFDLG